MAIDPGHIQATLLEIVSDVSTQYGPTQLSSGSILQEVARRLRDPNGRLPAIDEQQAWLTAFYDLFRTGHLSWGINLDNNQPAFCHLTKQGRRVLEHLSRDPSNPAGYIAHVTQRANLNPVATSYVEEALRAYNADCVRAAAVMIGAAAESMSLELRDVVVTGVTKKGKTPAKDLSHTLIKKVLDALHKEFEMEQKGMPHDLRERFQAYWPAFTQQVRATRNDAGHPASIEPVTQDSVRAALLSFPLLAELNSQLMEWVSTYY